MANIKPAMLQNGHKSNAEIEQRKDTEKKLQGKTKISVRALKELSEDGKKFYKKIISLLPEGFLNGGDAFVVNIVAESLDRMKECQTKINEEGLFDKSSNENQAVRTYEKYSKIFEKFSSKLGLSPKDRATLAVLVINEQAEKEDPVLKALRGED